MIVSCNTLQLLLKMSNVYESPEFTTKMQEIAKPQRRRRRYSWPDSLKFEFNMADERNSVGGSSMINRAGGDAGNGALSDDEDVHLNSGSYRRPFLIGVAGGTASGKV